MENNVETEKQATIDDLLLHAIDHQPKEFQAVFNDLLTQRITDRLEVAKQEVAQNYFNYTDAETEDSEESAEIETEESDEQQNEVEENGQDAETV